MSAVNTHLDAVRQKILGIESVKPIAEKIEEKTKINIEYFAVGLGAALLICIFSGFMASFIINVVGFGYPAYRSLVAIESKSKDDDMQWLIYWVVFGAFCILENFIDFILYWLPFYYPIKLSFLVWCMLPQFNGAQKVYEFIGPYFLKGVDSIDAALNKQNASAGDS